MMELRPLKPDLTMSITPETVALFSFACGVYDDPPDGPERLLWRSVTVIDLSCDSSVRAALRSLEATLNHVDFLEQEVLFTAVALAVRNNVARFFEAPTVVVLVLSEPNSCGKMRLRHVLDALDGSAGIGAIVVVAEAPASWGSISSARGYVKAGKGRLGMDAAQVALQAVSLIAPLSLSCIDLNDWCCALGDVDAPATLARAFWQQKENYRSLYFLDSGESIAVKTAEAVALLPLYPCIQFGQMREIGNAFSELIREDAGFALGAQGAIVRANEALNGPYQAVLALCRPRRD